MYNVLSFIIGLLAMGIFINSVQVKGDMNKDGILSITDLSILAATINEQR